MKRRPSVWVACVGLFLIGCGAPPVPDDHFYRLGNPESGQAFAEPLIEGKLLVEMPLAAGIRRERAILYSEDPAHVELRRYHYHLWEDQPPRMLQRRLVDRLATAGVAAAVTDQLSPDTAYRLRVRIERFERELDAGGASAAVALRFQLIRGHRQAVPLFDRSYSERVGADSGEMPATVTAFARAIDRVVDRFLIDLKAALGD